MSDMANRSVMASAKLGSWLSAALDDPNVCDEMKVDIREWFSAGEPVQMLCDRIAAMQADAEPDAWLYQNEVQQEYVSRERHPFRNQGVIQWTETPLYAHPPVEDRVSPPTSVDDSETGNTSDKLRDAREAAARAALEAAAQNAETWFPFDTNKRYPSFGVVASIRAIDPAQFREVR